MNNIIKLNVPKTKPRILYGRYDRTKIETIGMLGYSIQVYHYLMQWITSDNPPEKMIYNNKLYYYVSKQKIADDCGLSEKMVRMALDKLAGVPPTILRPFISKYYDNQAHKLWISIEEIPSKWVLATIPMNSERLIWIENNLSQDYVNNCIESYNNNEEADMPALFEIESEVKVNPNAKKIVDNVLNSNADIFKTKIGNTKTYRNCCKIIQDIYSGLFLNPRVYNFSQIKNCKWFDVDNWKNKINQVKGDYDKVENLIMKSIKNFRLMFDNSYMPFKKDCLPDSFEKWLYDSVNENYPSYFIFSFNKPNTNGKQLSEIKADNIYKELPEKIQAIGNDILENNSIVNKSVFWANLRGLYGWCKWLFDCDINQNVGYWVSSPAEIITKFVDYCDANNVLMNEYTFNVQNSLNNNAPFAWFISNAINEHKLNKEILKSCA